MRKKIALAVIVRDTEDEAQLLRRLLDSVKDHVDGMFITAASTQFEGHVQKVCEDYGANYSTFKWIKDFSAARNFNFSQVTKEYDFIMWSDVDDIWKGLEKLQDYLKDNEHKDSWAFWYLYGFDEFNQPVVVHKKTMLVKNDGTFVWKGRIHEDIDCDREVDIGFIEDIHRIHATTDERVEEAMGRNLEIAEKDFQEDKDDPRNFYNYGNALVAVEDFSKAAEVFQQFIKDTGSPEEKYLIYQRLGWAHHALGEKDEAVKCFQIALGMEPNTPDAFLEFGKFHFDNDDLDEAERYTLLGIARKPVYKAVTVFNPRDYDYNPMNLLAKIYFLKGRPDLALPCIQACLKVNDNPIMRDLEKEMAKELKKLEGVAEQINKLKKIKDKKKLKKALEEVPAEFQSHPGICMIRNAAFVKTESSGKDIVYYCGYTEHEWNPELFKVKGFGGSEEAVVHLSKALVERGMNVTVYANIGTKEMVVDGVKWRPYWDFNARDKVDHLILWRTPRMCDYDINAKNIYIDLHDVISNSEFTSKRLAKITKVFVKTKSHKILFPNVPEEKFAVIPNGIKTSDFDGEYEKDDMLIINTSSADRSVKALARVFKRIKKQVPEARCQWAYGWGLFDSFHKNDKKKMDWKKETVKDLEEAGVESLGRITQGDVAELYKKANILLYPTEFYEIDCISVKKAQLAGCQVISTDFAALEESIQHGVKIHSEKTHKNWTKPYQFDYSSDEKLDDAFVSETVAALKKKKAERKEMREWAKKFDWEIISDNWYKEINGN